MSEQRITQQKLILDKLLELVAFEGLSDATIIKAAVAANMHHMAGQRLFAGGVSELLAFYNTQLNDELQSLAAEHDLANMRTHERIEWLLMQRFAQLEPHKEAIRRITAYSALPWNIAGSGERLWQTCDVMWRIAGDKSLDYNYYSKRTLLAKVYGLSLIFWLNDDGSNDASINGDNMNDGSEQLQQFVQRQIAGVLNVGKKMGMANANITKFVENTVDMLINPSRYRTKKF